MIRFFKTLQPANMIIVPIIIFVMWVRIIFHANPVSDLKVLPFWTAITYFLNGIPVWINFLLLFGLISTQAIYFNLLINRHEVHYKNTFLPAFVFALLISSTPDLMQFHPIHLINLILLVIIDRAFTLYKSEFPVSALFDCGFMAGTVALMYFPAIVICLFILAVLFIIRPLSFKELLITLIGIFLPCFFLSTYLFWNHELVSFWKSYIGFFHNIHPRILIMNNLNILILAISIGIILIFSLLKLRMNYRKNIIRTRSYQQLFLILLILGAGWIFFVESIEIIHFAFLIIPLSVFCSYYFVSAKKGKWIYEFALWALIGIIIWNHLN